MLKFTSGDCIMYFDSGAWKPGKILGPRDEIGRYYVAPEQPFSDTVYVHELHLRFREEFEIDD